MTALLSNDKRGKMTIRVTQTQQQQQQLPIFCLLSLSPSDATFTRLNQRATF
jgi:hypothetical protein